ncbi:hypothetical protein QTP70_003961 [Hemibagrus guttatus]|uniref:Endonuclease/exonuclease/phosphatase domain-containing protein n=1 Tax=Hemibagrus guttatus TaxID=175788 RepID=A0AAE0RD10_9TELE|nr:hypothetical protein QTP70_003961 [Hemibagrus guttatus]
MEASCNCAIALNKLPVEMSKSKEMHPGPHGLGVNLYAPVQEYESQKGGTVEVELPQTSHRLPQTYRRFRSRHWSTERKWRVCSSKEREKMKMSPSTGMVNCATTSKNLRVSVMSPINLFIIAIYRPPGPLGDFMEEMDTLLSVFPSDTTPLTVLGDFSLPSDKLQQLPSHTQGRKHPRSSLHSSFPSYRHDYYVSFTITLLVLPKRNSQHLSLTRRNLHSISPSSVASCTLSSLPDHDSFSSLPLDSATDTFLSSLSSTMDLLCPLPTKRRKTSSAPWLSDVLRNNWRELRSAERKWKKSQLDTDLISYRTLLSKFSLDVTSAKTSFYKEKLETSAQDLRKLHNIFSSLLNPPAPPAPSSLTAEDFATFYTEKIEKIRQTFTSAPTSSTSHSQHSITTSLKHLSTVAASFANDPVLQSYHLPNGSNSFNYAPNHLP